MGGAGLEFYMNLRQRSPVRRGCGGLGGTGAAMGGVWRLDTSGHEGWPQAG